MLQTSFDSIGMFSDEFLKTSFQKKPYARAQAFHWLKGFFDWDMMTQILAVHDDCWLVKQGGLLSTQAHGKVLLPEFTRSFIRGGTLVVRHAENAHSMLAKFGELFKSRFGPQIDIQLFVTPKNSVGFEWHYDVEEVFVYQTVGSKEFFLRQPKAGMTLPHRSLPPEFNLNEVSEGPEMRCLLNAGYHLYIPAGYWHKARAVEDSFHISVGILPA